MDGRSPETVGSCPAAIATPRRSCGPWFLRRQDDFLGPQTRPQERGRGFIPPLVRGRVLGHSDASFGIPGPAPLPAPGRSAYLSSGLPLVGCTFGGGPPALPGATGGLTKLIGAPRPADAGNQASVWPRDATGP